jgi:hypothetical protein
VPAAVPALGHWLSTRFVTRFRALAKGVYPANMTLPNLDKNGLFKKTKKTKKTKKKSNQKT